MELMVELEPTPVHFHNAKNAQINSGHSAQNVQSISLTIIALINTKLDVKNVIKKGNNSNDIR